MIKGETMHAPKKDDLRDEKNTWKNKFKQSQHDLATKERCYQAVMKQRDEAEVKVAMLTTLIDEVIFDDLSHEVKEIVRLEMIRIGV